MQKSSSHPKLTELAHSPANSHGNAFVKALPRPRSHESLSAATQTKAFSHTHVNVNVNVNATPAADILFAVTQKGLAASECLVNIEEIERAPALVDSNDEVSSQLAFASCIAQQVIPEVGNGEIVASKAAELKDAASKMVEARYARETTTRVAVEGGTERGDGSGGEAEVEAAAKGESTATRLSRKRSRGDLSVEEKEALEERIEEQLAKNTVVVDE